MRRIGGKVEKVRLPYQVIWLFQRNCLILVCFSNWINIILSFVSSNFNEWVVSLTCIVIFLASFSHYITQIHAINIGRLRDFSPGHNSKRPDQKQFRKLRFPNWSHREAIPERPPLAPTVLTTGPLKLLNRLCSVGDYLLWDGMLPPSRCT